MYLAVENINNVLLDSSFSLMMAGVTAFDRKTIDSDRLRFPSLTLCPMTMNKTSTYNTSIIKVSVTCLQCSGG
jgi:hypothetical protein